MRAKPRLIAALVSAFVLLALVVGANASTRTCTSCHTVLVAASTDAAHAQVSCFACHAPTVGSRVSFAWVQGTRMLPKQLTGSEGKGPSLETSREACLRCHETINDGVLPGDTGIKIKHSACAASGSCDTCHSATAHGAATRWVREPVMEQCTGCHADQGAPLACDTCHVGKYQKERLTVGPWQITHGREWRGTHGMGDLRSCTTCHPADYCVRCHKVVVPHPQDFGSTHGTKAIAHPDACKQCHKSEAFCQACHGIKMPHPSRFLQGHSSVATGLEDPACVRCHLSADCAYCHERHVHPGNAKAAAAGTPKRPGAVGR